MDELLTVKTVSSLSGVSIHCLRAWERRYQAIQPKRTSTHRRVYSRLDVQKLILLNRLLERGYTIGNIAQLKVNELDDLVEKLPPKPFSNFEFDFEPNIRQMLLALTEYKLDLLDYELMRARATFPVPSLILKVFGILMREVGQRVVDQKLGIAQEHALSALVRGHLGQIFQSVNQRTGTGVRVLLGTQEGDLHEFGILMSAILCASRGMAVFYLGQSLPPEDLASAATGTQAQLIILGSTPLPAGTTPVSLETYLKRLTDRLSSGMQIWVGGDATRTINVNDYSRKVQAISTLDHLSQMLESFP